MLDFAPCCCASISRGETVNLDDGRLWTLGMDYGGTHLSMNADRVHSLLATVSDDSMHNKGGTAHNMEKFGRVNKRL